jgi:site-specific DNA recombinase
MINYFLYARKSTDVEDKQVRSIEDQLAVLRALAKQERLNVIHEFVEKQSAKIPGRPVFDDMLVRIGKGEAQGIICWKLDRLARNPVDGGQISWMLQRGIIQHIQTNERSYNPTDNVLMMSVEFGMANQYILDLSSNTKRGLYEKAKRGDYPGIAPLGYLNDPRTKTVVMDKKKSQVLKQAFELYSQNRSRLEDIAMFLFEHGIKTRKIKRNDSKGDKPLKRDQVGYILANPFYCGLFRYGGELYEGKHQPIITKQLFDKVQEVLAGRGKPHRKASNPKPLCGLLKCGECGRMITAETQKGHTYYRCTKKNIKCSQPYIRQEALDTQLSKVLKKYIMPKDWAEELQRLAEQDSAETAKTTNVLVQDLRSKVADIDRKLQRLKNIYLDQDIEQEDYRTDKNKLVSEKKSLEEQISRIQQHQNSWLEPYKQWLKDAQNLREITLSPEMHPKKSAAQKIFGSNLFLKNQKIEFVPQMQWAALSAALGKVGKIPLCNILVGRVGIEPTTNGLKGRCSTN